MAASKVIHRKNIDGAMKTYQNELPLLSGRVKEDEKKVLKKISKDKKSKYAIELRKYMDKLHNIDWDEVKRMKGESLKGIKTVSVNFRVKPSRYKETNQICEENHVTVSSFVRYLVIGYIKENQSQV